MQIVVICETCVQPLNKIFISYSYYFWHTNGTYLEILKNTHKFYILHKINGKSDINVISNSKDKEINILKALYRMKNVF